MFIWNSSKDLYVYKDHTIFEGEKGAERTPAEQVEYLAELVENTQSSQSKTAVTKTTGMDGIY